MLCLIVLKINKNIIYIYIWFTVGFGDKFEHLSHYINFVEFKYEPFKYWHFVSI